MTNPDQPVFVQPEDRLIPVSAHLGGLASIPPSRIFLIRKSLAEFKAKHRSSLISSDFVHAFLSAVRPRSFAHPL